MPRPGPARNGTARTWRRSDAAAKPFLWKSKLGIFTVSPSIAYKVSEKFMVGATLDINYGMLTMDQPFELGQYTEDLKGWAFNGTLGLLIKPSEMLSIGAVLQAPLHGQALGRRRDPERAPGHGLRGDDRHRHAGGGLARCGSAAASPSSPPTS